METLASQPTSHNPKDGLADEQEVSNSLTQKERERSRGQQSCDGLPQDRVHHTTDAANADYMTHIIASVLVLLSPPYR